MKKRRRRRGFSSSQTRKSEKRNAKWDEEMLEHHPVHTVWPTGNGQRCSESPNPSRAEPDTHWVRLGLGVPLKWHCFTYELVLVSNGCLSVCSSSAQRAFNIQRIRMVVCWCVYVCIIYTGCVWKEAKIERPALRRIIISVYMTQFYFSSFSPHSMRLINLRSHWAGLACTRATHSAHESVCVGHRLWKVLLTEFDLKDWHSHGQCLHQINLKHSFAQFCCVQPIGSWQEMLEIMSVQFGKPPKIKVPSALTEAKWSWINSQANWPKKCWALPRSRFLRRKLLIKTLIFLHENRETNALPLSLWISFYHQKDKRSDQSKFVAQNAPP